MIYVILGQTASGKTDLVCKLCRELDLPFISADAFQVYKDFNIGSAKPSQAELQGIKYHCIDDVTPNEKFSIKHYQNKVRDLIKYYQDLNKDIIISGGSFLYVKAALFNYELSDEILDESLLNELESKDLNELVEILKKEDIESYNFIDLNNKRRVVRAVYRALKGDKKSSIENDSNSCLYPCKFFNIDISKQDLIDRMNKRVDKMFDLGLIDEVKSLLLKYPSTCQAFKGIGYKQIVDGLNNNLSIEDMKNDVKLATRQYGKRQRTFLRHQFPNLITLNASDIYEYIKYDTSRRLRNKASINSKILNKLENANICLVGLGGVGSIIASSLVRLGVYKLTVIDKDIVDSSNINRQILYTKENVGMNKVDACKLNLLKIDSYSQIKAYNQAFDVSLLETKYDFVFDCIDDVKSKVDLILYCINNNISYISATGSGLRYKSNFYRIGTLLDTGEPLAKAIKKELLNRSFSEFNKVNVTYSLEQPVKRLTSYIGSNVISPNSQGLMMITAFLDYLNK